MSEDRATIGYDAQKFYLGLALDPSYVERFVEGCLKRIGEDEPEDENLFSDLWEDEGERETVLMVLQRSVRFCPADPRTTSLVSPKPLTSRTVNG